MGNRLYIGGLPYSTTEEALSAHFAQAGAVTNVMIVKDKQTRQSRGFGFVEMADGSAAEKAIEMFNGQEFEGRTLTVSEARPLEPRDSRPRGRDDRGGDRGGYNSKRW